jgi:putative NADH-flavin reductase
MLADRRWRHAQPPGRPGKGSFRHHGSENRHSIQFIHDYEVLLTQESMNMALINPIVKYYIVDTCSGESELIHDRSKQMKVAIIGATGFVGRRVVDEALNRGLQVTAIARQQKDLPDNANLTIALGDVADTEWLAKQLTGQDAVISAFNPGWAEEDLYEKTTRGSQQILDAVKKSGVKRLLVVGGAGSLEVAPGVELVDTPQFPENIRPGAQAVRDLRNKLRNDSQLDWTYLSPAALLEPGKRTGQFRLGTTKLLMNGQAPAGISVEDLSVAIIDEIEKPQFIKAQFTAAY